MEWACSAEFGVTVLLRALLFLSPLLGPGRRSSVALELATAVGSRGVSRSKPNWSKERLKGEAEWGRERRRCGGSEEEMMVAEENGTNRLTPRFPSLAFPRPTALTFPQQCSSAVPFFSPPVVPSISLCAPFTLAHK